MSQEPLLTVKEVDKSFGGLLAVNNLSFNIYKGQIYGLIGPNGAGKTTVFNLITGVYSCTKGSIFSGNIELTQLKPHAITRLGFARTFQTIRLFANMTALEHVMVGQNFLARSPIGGILPLNTGNERNLREQAKEILILLGLWEVRHQRALTLPYGIQRKVEIARALATQPKLFLLDEPTAGLNIQETKDLLKTLNKIHQQGITLLIIEHDMRVIMELCDHIFVLNFGQKIAEGNPDQIRISEQVIEAYLGKEE
jgi:branched-chain amino acid transport system ATP-binding protein